MDQYLYMSRYTDCADMCIVSEPLKMRNIRTPIPSLHGYQCIGIYNASRKTCNGLTLNLVDGRSMCINLPMNGSYFASGTISSIILGTPSIWCYALYKPHGHGAIPKEYPQWGTA